MFSRFRSRLGLPASQKYELLPAQATWYQAVPDEEVKSFDIASINAQLLREITFCERRVWLDRHGDKSTRDAPSAGTVQRLTGGIEHEEVVHRATTARIQPLRISSWCEGVELTQDAMGQGVRAILGAHLENTVKISSLSSPIKVRGIVDRLSRLRRKPAVYAPVEIKSYNELEERDFVQLDYYIWLLSTIQGVLTPGWFWLGRGSFGRPAQKIEQHLNVERLEAALTQAGGILQQLEAPPVRIEGYCKYCPWYSSCRLTGIKEGQIGLLPGLRKDSAEHLQQSGIVTLEQLVAFTPGELRSIRYIGEKTAPRIHATAKAILENHPIWLSPLPALCHQPGLMFDLETESTLFPFPWSLGWMDTSGKAHVILVSRRKAETPALVFPDGSGITFVSDYKLAWRVFDEVAGQTEGPVYHWSAYDLNVLHNTASEDIVARLEPRMYDLFATVRATVKFPIVSYTLKSVASFLKFAWPGYENAFEARRDYEKWLLFGDQNALLRACTYQRADVQSLGWVWRWLVANEPQE